MREISLHILDIVQNSIRAGAERVDIEVDVDEPGDRLTVVVRDDGAGMPEDMLLMATDPWTTCRTERKVGLGLPLLEAACVQTGGRLEIDSAPGKGTEVRAVFGLSSIDRQPMGDLAETVGGLASSYPDRQIRLVVRRAGEVFSFDSKEIAQALDGVPISTPSVVKWMAEHINEGVSSVVTLE